MMSYILLLVLVILIVVGVLRASKQERKRRRPQREPNIGMGAKKSQDAEIIVQSPEPEVQDRTDSVQAAKIEESTLTPEPAAVIARGQPATSHEPHPDEEGEQLSIDPILIHLFTDGERPYKGYELLQALLTSGLRYGKRGIFHRHEDLTGRGSILFSLAQAVEPGTFDLPKMGGFTTPGLVLFMMSSQVQNSLAAFDLMITTAKDLQKDLGGNLYDEKRQLLTTAKIEQLRSRLKISSRDD